MCVCVCVCVLSTAKLMGTILFSDFFLNIYLIQIQNHIFGIIFILVDPIFKKTTT